MCVIAHGLMVCLQLEKLKEFASSLKATEDHNFQYAGTNIEKIMKEKVYTCAPLFYRQRLSIIACG